MKIRIVLFVSLCLAPFYSFSATQIFSRTLHSGMRGEDVLALQKFLNTDTETRVADTGAGSLGNETDYFGPATKRAVIKFQDKYRTDVLVPSGLKSGTGFFGEKTIAKMNALIGTAGVTATTSVLAKVASADVEKGEVLVLFPSQYSGTPGTIITLSGFGFTALDNTIYFGEKYAVNKAVSLDKQTITFRIPTIPKGIYDIFVKNARGDSNKDTFFVVTDGVTPEPKIKSINASASGIVTIKGNGFTKDGNRLRTSLRVFNNISSPDGYTLSFIIPTDIFATTTISSIVASMNVFASTTPFFIAPESAVPAEPSEYPKKISLPVWAYVVNENGVSNGESYIFSF